MAVDLHLEASLIIWTKSHAFRRSAEYRALYDLDRWKLGKARLANFLSTDPRIPTEESGVSAILAHILVFRTNAHWIC